MDCKVSCICCILYVLSFAHMDLNGRKHVYSKNHVVCVAFFYDCFRTNICKIGNVMKNIYLSFVFLNLILAGYSVIVGSNLFPILFNLLCAAGCWVGYINSHSEGS